MTTLRRTISCLGFLVGVGVIASGPVAMAQGIVPLEQRHPFTADTLPIVMDVPVTPFDTQGGRYTLLSVRLDVFANAATRLSAENDAAFPAPGFAVVLNGFTAARLEDMVAFRLFNRMYFTSGVSASDGVAGSGPDYWDFGFVTAHGQASKESAAPASAFTGGEMLDVQVVIDGAYRAFGTPLATVTTGDDRFDGEVVVTYNYGITCPGDVDGDLRVGLTDLLGVLARWGACDGCDADLDGDGEVGFDDLVTVLGTWGVDCRE